MTKKEARNSVMGLWDLIPALRGEVAELRGRVQELELRDDKRTAPVAPTPEDEVLYEAALAEEEDNGQEEDC